MSKYCSTVCCQQTSAIRSLAGANLFLKNIINGVCAEESSSHSTVYGQMRICGEQASVIRLFKTLKLMVVARVRIQQMLLSHSHLMAPLDHYEALYYTPMSSLCCKDLLGTSSTSFLRKVHLFFSGLTAGPTLVLMSTGTAQCTAHHMKYSLEA